MVADRVYFEGTNPSTRGIVNRQNKNNLASIKKQPRLVAGF
jgi:hypothetical protein